MKHSDLLKAFLLIAFSSIILTACKKDKNNKNSCTVIAEVRYLSASTITVNNNVTYNDNGTVSYKLEDGRIETWHYPGTITIMGVAGENWYQKIITLNEYGMLTSFRTDYDAISNLRDMADFVYQNGIELISSSSGSTGQFPASYVYTWSKGNLITQTLQGPGESKYLFAYSTNRPSVIGDYFTHSNIYSYQGFRVLGSKNLPVSVQFSDQFSPTDSSFTSFSYQYDKDGKIKTMTTTDGAGQSSKVDYVYQCGGDNYSK